MDRLVASIDGAVLSPTCGPRETQPLTAASSWQQGEGVLALGYPGNELQDDLLVVTFGVVGHLPVVWWGLVVWGCCPGGLWSQQDGEEDRQVSGPTWPHVRTTTSPTQRGEHRPGLSSELGLVLCRDVGRRNKPRRPRLGVSFHRPSFLWAPVKLIALERLARLASLMERTLTLPYVGPSRFPSRLTPVATATLTLTIRPSSRTFLGQRIQPQVGIRSAVQGTAEEGIDHGVQFRADARDLAHGDALAAKRFHINAPC